MYHTMSPVRIEIETKNFLLARNIVFYPKSSSMMIATTVNCCP